MTGYKELNFPSLVRSLLTDTNILSHRLCESMRGVYTLTHPSSVKAQKLPAPLGEFLRLSDLHIETAKDNKRDYAEVSHSTERTPAT